ncbi:uncharacterized protein TNCV_3081191 [Trichonephila clavipes]|nr:uncharacterized protein TNCV_3081191 [Trichonephila clavipes]
MFQHLKDCLEKLAIYDAVWILSKEETFYQVFFPCEGPGMECDFVLQSIQNRGIGEKGLSTVGIMPCDVFYRDYGEDDEDQGEDSDNENGDENQSPDKKGKGFKAMQKEFLKSVTARLTVAQVVERVKNDGSLSFDFIMFVFIASCIAALGLSENSAIVIVAAMLISPIMGPIMAFTFGLTIRDKKLVRMALRTELIGLSVCLISGFLFGFICGNFSETWGAGKWPTSEMAGRTSSFILNWTSNQRLKPDNPLNYMRKHGFIDFNVDTSTPFSCITPIDSFNHIEFLEELLTSTPKHSSHPELLKQLALEVINDIPDQALIIYTDGSRLNTGRAGSGIKTMLKSASGILTTVPSLDRNSLLLVVLSIMLSTLIRTVSGS